jgi:hypothetical protein
MPTTKIVSFATSDQETPDAFKTVVRFSETCRVWPADAVADLERLENAVQTPTLPDLDTASKMIGGWRAAVLASDVEGRRRALAELIDGINLDRIKRGQHSMTIHWTELGETLRRVAATLGDAPNLGIRYACADEIRTRPPEPCKRAAAVPHWGLLARGIG